MKLFCLSKFNQLVALCALVVAISSFPATAVAEEACVKTSTGDIVWTTCI